jgi:hypothetical protein
VILSPTHATLISVVQDENIKKMEIAVARIAIFNIGKDN